MDRTAGLTTNLFLYHSLEEVLSANNVQAFNELLAINTLLILTDDLKSFNNCLLNPNNYAL